MPTKPPTIVHSDYRPKRPPKRKTRAGKVELLTGIEGVTSRPMRRIVLMK